ncbi:hypothetical protein BH11PSE11_BH11PSE11_28980 [soil metagenome]
MPTQTATIRQTGDIASRVSQNLYRYKRISLGLLASQFALTLLVFATGTAQAANAPTLGQTSTYGVVSTTFTNANTAPQTIINGSVCYTIPPGTPPLSVTGLTVTPCPAQVGLDQNAALAQLNGQPCVSLGAGAVALDGVIVGANPPGTIPPGCYSSGGAMNVTVGTTVTLTGNGVYVFRPGGALTTGANSRVILAGGACASDVYWAPGGATSLGANAALSLTPTFVGNIWGAADITIGHFANLTGRALAFGGTVTTDAVTVTVPSCAAFGSQSQGIPTLGEWAMVLLASLLGFAGFAAIRRRR